MAKYILAIPITTVASESTFSMGGRIINKLRSCMFSRHVEAITFGNWLYGYDESIVEGVTIGKEYHVVAIDGRELDFANCKFLVVYIILSF